MIGISNGSNQKGNGWYIATDDTNVSSQGRTYKEAKNLLKEAKELYSENEHVGN